MAERYPSDLTDAEWAALLKKRGVLLLGKLLRGDCNERRTPGEFPEAGTSPQGPRAQRNRVPAWQIALGLVLYHLGLSFRKTAGVLCLLGREVSHVAVWYWNKKAGKGLRLHEGPLPGVIVVDETWVKVGGKGAWIYVALDPRTLKVIYLEPFFVRDEGTTNAFLEHLVEAYGQWPKLVITDGGSWYRAAFSFWQLEGKITWRIV